MRKNSVGHRAETMPSQVIRPAPEPERGHPGRSRLDTRQVPDYEAYRPIPTRCGQDGRAPVLGRTARKKFGEFSP
ncbi:MAG: hypothetical protein L0Z50_24025 [Verrucomicrobiales bacterium]|nr:hypothetical protein [Verrucomicrobiales bacterium]